VPLTISTAQERVPALTPSSPLRALSLRERPIPPAPPWLGCRFLGPDIGEVWPNLSRALTGSGGCTHRSCLGQAPLLCFAQGTPLGQIENCRDHPDANERQQETIAKHRSPRSRDSPFRTYASASRQPLLDRGQTLDHLRGLWPDGIAPLVISSSSSSVSRNPICFLIFSRLAMPRNLLGSRCYAC
jgi:hypothetical protein